MDSRIQWLHTFVVGSFTLFLPKLGLFLFLFDFLRRLIWGFLNSKTHFWMSNQTDCFTWSWFGSQTISRHSTVCMCFLMLPRMSVASRANLACRSWFFKYLQMTYIEAQCSVCLTCFSEVGGGRSQSHFKIFLLVQWDWRLRNSCWFAAGVFVPKILQVWKWLHRLQMKLGLFYVCMRLAPFQTHTSHALLLLHSLHLFFNCFSLFLHSRSKTFCIPLLHHSACFSCSSMLPLPPPSPPQMLNHPTYAPFSLPSLFLPLHLQPFLSFTILTFHPFLPFLLFVLLFLITTFLFIALVCGIVTALLMYCYIFHIHLSHLSISLCLAGSNYLGECTAPCWNKVLAVKHTAIYKNSTKQHPQFCLVNTHCCAPAWPGC